MPNKTIYITPEDEELWNSISNKSQFVSSSLRSASNNFVSQAKEGQMKVVNAAIDLGQAIAKHKSVDTCPHGFAKGFCKKADCNRKYA